MVTPELWSELVLWPVDSVEYHPILSVSTQLGPHIKLLGKTVFTIPSNELFHFTLIWYGL